MRTGAYVAAPCIGDMTMLHIGHIGPEDPGQLCSFSERLLVHAWRWNPKVPDTVMCARNHNHLGRGGGNIVRARARGRPEIKSVFWT